MLLIAVTDVGNAKAWAYILKRIECVSIAAMKFPIKRLDRGRLNKRLRGTMGFAHRDSAHRKAGMQKADVASKAITPGLLPTKPSVSPDGGRRSHWMW
jgi:hypothetical protein